jgi:hypothetical protein
VKAPYPTLMAFLVFGATLATTVSAAPTAAQKKFVDYLIKSGDEPKIKDATWATDENLYVGVISDGTRRDGFAEYLCSVASDRHSEGQQNRKVY